MAQLLAGVKLGDRRRRGQDQFHAPVVELVDECDEPSRLYQTVLVSNVPRFDGTLENQARRFIALVDEFYDRRVKLILSAATPVIDLYAGEKLRHEILRTQSRLQEMQTRDYLATAHMP